MNKSAVPKVTAFRVAFVYACVGSAYILTSDQLLIAVSGNYEHYQALQTAKGWAFIGLTSLALWYTLHSAWASMDTSLAVAVSAKDHLRLALTAASGAVWSASRDTNGTIWISATGGLARAMGLKDDEAVSSSAIAELLVASERDEFDNKLALLLSGIEATPKIVWQMRDKDGGTRWIKIVADSRSQSTNSDREVLGVAFDITDLQTSAANLAEVIASGELATWRLDLRTGENEINDRWAALIGYSREELGPINLDKWYALTHPDDTAHLAGRHAAQFAKGNYFFKEEIRMRHKEGHWVWVQSRGRAVEFLDDGTAAVMAGVHVDISQRRALQEELQTERDFLLQLTETSVSGILALSAKGEVLFANKEAEAILGISSSEMVGRQHDDPSWHVSGIDGKVLAGSDYPFIKVMRDGKIVRDYRMLIKLKDGKERTISVNAAPTPSREGGSQVVCVITDITDQLADQDRLARTAGEAQYAALHDHMTGLPNREQFEDFLEIAIAKSAASLTKLMQVFIDVDNFKQINDRFGHQLGDDLICQIADRLGKARTGTQFLARVAGDEFTFIHPFDEQDPNPSVLASLAAVFDQPFELAGTSVYISASMGISIFPLDAATATEIWLNSDLAMYKAKSSGRNLSVQFSSDLRDQIAREAHISQRLQNALRERAFVMVLQPKVSLSDPHEIVGAEALLRCTDPELKGVGPAVFLPIAERSGLMRSIDLMVIDLVCKVVSEFDAVGVTMPISVNLSPDSLRQLDFGAMALAILSKANMSGKQVSFELTEGTMIDGESVARESIELLLDAGFQFSVDDFGTGYSSLSYLHQLKLAEIKIDRSFVSRIGQVSDSSDAIVRAILAMSHALGLCTVAEGVETHEQVDWLHNHGCQVGQGYLFGEAVVPSVLIQFFLQRRENVRSIEFPLLAAR